MNFADLLQDAAAFEEWRRLAFPIFNRKIFLTHASVSPLPAAAGQALAAYVARLTHEGQFDYIHDAIYKSCKERLARMIGHGAASDEIAFAGSTSHALGLVATSLDWKPGDNCIVADGDFPANVTIWKNLAHTHGVEVRLIPYRPNMDICLDDVAPLVDERTRIVSLSSANFLTGCPLDPAPIGAWLHKRGVLFCLDSIQTLGATRLDAAEVDFVCADAHKWLLGPNGIAVLWARRAAMQQMRPMIFGWLSSKDRDNWFSYDTTPIDSAERFEPGARNYLGVVALEATLHLYEETGAEFIEARVSHLRDYAAKLLQERGCKLLWTPDPARRAGIVSFQPPSGDTAECYKRLDEKFALSLRQDKDGAAWIRVSPHWMNSEDDLQQLADSIQ